MCSTHKKMLLTVVAMFALATFVVGCGRDSVAKVNGHRITRQEYYTRLERVQLPSPKGGQQEAGATVLQRLIDEELVLELAEKEKVSPTEAQIKERDDQAKKQPELAKNLKTSGLTKEQFKQMLRVEQAAFNLQTIGVTVSDKEIKDFYDKYKQNLFTRPEHAFLSIIVVKTKADVDKAMKMLGDNVDFGTVARSMSIDKTTASKDGRLDKAMIRGDHGVPAAIQSVVFNTPAGKYTKPIQVGGSFLICKVMERRTATTQKFDDVKYQIRQQLMVQKGVQKRVNLSEDMAKFRDNAKINVDIERYKTLLAPAKNN